MSDNKPHGPTLQEAQATTEDNHVRLGWHAGRAAAVARLDALMTRLEALEQHWRQRDRDVDQVPDTPKYADELAVILACVTKAHRS